MSDKQTLLDLAARCEAATGPDRELDCRIAAACHPSMKGEWCVVGPPTYDPPRYFSGQPEVDWIGYDLLNHSPAYSRSIDAAMTLVPEGVFFAVGSNAPKDKRGGYSASVGPSWWEDRAYGRAATPALALCAAALRAKASKL